MSLTGADSAAGVLQVGYRLADDYEIVRVLGSGGFGNTYLAKDITLARDVAIKEYFPREIAHRDATLAVGVSEQFRASFKWGLERFVQEGRLLARFRHPNIVRVFRTLDANDSAYIILDYVHGQDLDTWLDGLARRPSQEEMDELLAPLIDALALVHTAGVLHRDIKPANIRIREETGDPVLLDFGASKLSMGELTGTTMAIISRGYSPYEAYAADSGAQGPWTDIYALGATIYRALTEQAPPEATERLLEDLIVPLKEQRFPGYRREFLAAVDWALSVSPNQRPQSIEVWRGQLFSGGDATIVNWKTTRSLTHRPGQTLDRKEGPSESAGAHRRDLSQPMGTVVRRSRKFFAALVFLFVILAAGAASLIAATEPDLIDNEWLRSAFGQARRLTGQSVTALLDGQAKPNEQVAGAPPAARTLAPAGPPPTPPAETVSDSKAGAVAKPAPPPAVVTTAALPAAPEGAAPPTTAKATGEPGRTRSASEEVIKPTQSIAPAPITPEYAPRTFGAGGDAERVAVAVVSPDGTRIASGGSDGSLRSWSTASGEEKTIGRVSGGAVLALDFIGNDNRFVAAAVADGSIVLGDITAAKVVTLGRTSLERGFVRAVAYSLATGDLVAVETSANETRLSRWSIGGGSDTPTATIPLGSYMARATAISRQTNTVVIATEHEALLAYDPRDGRLKEALSWINAAPEWTTTLALTLDARTIARGGLYSQVEIFDLDAKSRKAAISLSQQAHTVWLAFSQDGQRLAIDHIAFENRIAHHRIRVVDVATGRAIVEVERPHDRRRWVSFMPSARNPYWLASTSDGQVRLCDTNATCRMTGAPP